MCTPKQANCFGSVPKKTHGTEQTVDIFVILGASGNLASKKIYPALWCLFRDGFLPEHLHIFGYARSQLTIKDVRIKCQPHMKIKPEDEIKFEEFWAINVYLSGKYDTQNDLEKLNQAIEQWEKTTSISNRLFYLAIPPTVLEDITLLLHKTCLTNKGWFRIIIEKPFGKDSQSSQKLTDHLAILYNEHQIYRIDHYLGKEMVQNLLTLRFGNKIFGPIWNRDNIASVQITFKENIGIEGRSGYFNEFGILRDVMQNHLLQILTLVAMERPASLNPDDIRDEKVKVLKNIAPLELSDVVLGQYASDPENGKVGYLDEPGVPKDSVTPTYAAAVLRINNERWDGIPFILKCGKGLDYQKAEVRIQFDDVPGGFFKDIKRNELIIRVQPGEAIYIKCTVKTPTLIFHLEENTLDLTYKDRFGEIKLPEAYERLILDVFSGTQMHFVCSAELVEAWRIFTPLLNTMEMKKIKPIPYKFGSKGPKDIKEILKNNNFNHKGCFKWYKSYN